MSEPMSMKRTGLRRMSVKRRSELAQRAAIRELVFERDRYRCRLNGVEGAGECFGILTPHHVRKASQGGPYTVENLQSLCSSHNSRLESDADLAALAREMGLVERRSA